MHNIADDLNNVSFKKMVYILHTYIAFPRHFSCFGNIDEH